MYLLVLYVLGNEFQGESFMIFPPTELKLMESFLPFQGGLAMLALFQLSKTSPSFHTLSDTVGSRLVYIQTSSFSTLE